MTDYCTTAEVKNIGGITSVNTDAVIAALITAASVFIDTYCDRDFINHPNVTETRNGTGGCRLIPLNAPVSAVASLLVNGTPVPAASNATSDGFVYDTDQIYLRGYTFYRGVQNVQIQYSGGYATVPADIKQACIDLVLFKLAKRDRMDKNSEVLQGQSVSFSRDDMPPYVKTTLNSYRRWMV